MEAQETDIRYQEDGFIVIDDVYSAPEIDAIGALLESADCTNQNFRKTTDLFAIRQFLKEIPGMADLIFKDNLRSLIARHMGTDYFVVKSIYFDKPELSNWMVPWHQDITISVDRRQELDSFHGWTAKSGQYSVCPPVSYLENICTLRIHLDDTDADNGALKIVPGSHSKGIIRLETISHHLENPTLVPISKGGIMLMKPLLIHASEKSTNSNKRRVIHIEFSNRELPGFLQWSERMTFPILF
jgi:hypothetical protein